MCCNWKLHGKKLLSKTKLFPECVFLLNASMACLRGCRTNGQHNDRDLLLSGKRLMRSCQLSWLGRCKSKARLGLVVISEKNRSFQQRSFLTRGCAVEEDITPLKNKPASHISLKPFWRHVGKIYNRLVVIYWVKPCPSWSAHPFNPCLSQNPRPEVPNVSELLFSILFRTPQFRKSLDLPMP